MEKVVLDPQEHASPLAIGVKIDDRYEIRERLTETPAYVEYRAFDHEVEVEVALWQLRLDLFPTDPLREELLLTAQELRALSHPHVRRIFGAGETDKVLYVTLQLTAPWGKLVREGPRSEEELLAVSKALSEALDAAHAAGHVHGRLLVGDVVQVAGLVKVGAIGLLQGMDPQAAQNRWEEQQYFLAPEVRAGGVGTPAADVYGMAKLITYFATGGVDSPIAALDDKHKAVVVAMEAGLAEEPEKRPTVSALASALRNVFIPQQPTHLTWDESKTEPDAEARPAPRNPHFDLDHNKPGKQPKKVAEDEEGTSPTRVLEEQFRASGDSRGPESTTVPGYSRILTDLGLQSEESSEMVFTAKQDWESGTPSAEIAKPVPNAQLSGPVPQSEFEEGEHSPVSPFGGAVPEPVPGKVRRRTSRHGMGARLPQSRKSRSLTWLLGALPLAVLGGAIGAWVAEGAETTVSSRQLRAIRLQGSPKQTAQKNSASLQRVKKRRNPRDRVKILVSALPTVPSNGCPEGMVLVRATRSYCVDAYEAPGRRRMPAAGMSVETAMAACNARGARLCSTTEWDQACRGERGASWPYGEEFQEEACNIGKRKKQEVAIAGSYPRCRSSVGAFDMSGNVAEWVSEGVIKGGSAAMKSKGNCSQYRRPEATRGYSDVGYRCCVSLQRPP